MNNSTAQTNRTSSRDDRLIVVVHCDGAGARPDGKGSGFAWIQPETGQKHVERIDGLTNNQAEYRALISTLSNIPDESRAKVFADSQLMVYQAVLAQREMEEQGSRLV